MNLIGKLKKKIINMFEKPIAEPINKKKFTNLINNDFGEYHYNILAELHKKYNLKGKKIIDIGGSNIPIPIMQAYGVERFVCLDSVSKWRSFHKENQKINFYYDKKVISPDLIKTSLDEGEFCFIIDSEIEELTIQNELLSYFDIIISISTFEHVTNINKTMNKIYDLLKPQGIFFTSYEPIFSSPVGHHVYINSEICFENSPEINFSHLLHSKKDVETILLNKDKFNPHIEQIIYQIFDSNIISRKMFNEHIIEIMNSKFNSYNLTYFNTMPVDDSLIKILTEKYGQMRYDVRGMRITAIK